jgi:hypothetical protein
VKNQKSSFGLRCLVVLLWLDSHLGVLLISFNSWLFTSQHLHGHATYDVHPIDNDSSACMMNFSVYNVYLHVAFNVILLYTGNCRKTVQQQQHMCERIKSLL